MKQPDVMNEHDTTELLPPIYKSSHFIFIRLLQFCFKLQNRKNEDCCSECAPSPDITMADHDHDLERYDGRNDGKPLDPRKTERRRGERIKDRQRWRRRLGNEESSSIKRENVRRQRGNKRYRERIKDTRKAHWNQKKRADNVTPHEALEPQLIIIN